MEKLLHLEKVSTMILLEEMFIPFSRKSIQTEEQSIDIDLDEGINQIRITTGLNVKESLRKSILILPVFYTPNPFRTNYRSILGQDTAITIELYTTQGRLLKTSEHQLGGTQRVIQLDTRDLKPGYIIKAVEIPQHNLK